MWSHYAENHKGICVEYDFRNYRKVLHLEKVKYANDVVKFPQGGFEGFNRIFCTKALSWSYEHEWRLILNAEKAGEMDAPKINRIFLGCEFDHTGELSENLKEFAQRESIPLFQMKKSPTNIFWKKLHALNKRMVSDRQTWNSTEIRKQKIPEPGRKRRPDPGIPFSYPVYFICTPSIALPKMPA